jgi:predicted transcriptional regulator
VEPETKVISNMVQEFVKRVFNGSPKPLLIHLVDNLSRDDEQLDEIRALLKEKKLLKEKRREK